MLVREAVISDIAQIQIVRHSVKENMLSNPGLVTDQHCNDYLTKKGKGWVCEIDQTVVGFSIVDFEGNNIWALFVIPEKEGMGIGRQLHDTMLDWYFNQTNKKVWLSTSPKTRAEAFYRKSGWKDVGWHGKAEIKFEMTIEDWKGRLIANDGSVPA
ncbi:MAG: GNAT family N-acetyltransferase [Chitinophagaceae bacterium]